MGTSYFCLPHPACSSRWAFIYGAFSVSAISVTGPRHSLPYFGLSTVTESPVLDTCLHACMRRVRTVRNSIVAPGTGSTCTVGCTCVCTSSMIVLCIQSTVVDVLTSTAHVVLTYCSVVSTVHRAPWSATNTAQGCKSFLRLRILALQRALPAFYSLLPQHIVLDHDTLSASSWVVPTGLGHSLPIGLFVKSHPKLSLQGAEYLAPMCSDLPRVPWPAGCLLELSVRNFTALYWTR